MKKRIWILCFLITVLMSCLALFVACTFFEESGPTTSYGHWHTYRSWKVIKKSTCLEPGIRERCCNTCGQIDTEEIPLSDHVYEYENTCALCGEPLNYTLGLEFEPYQSGYAVTGIGTTTDINIVIPVRYAGRPVLKIAEKAFANCDTIRSIYIPNGVRYIGASAFSWCDMLKIVALPDTLISIDANAFLDCISLKSIEITAVESIGYKAFAECLRLTEIVLPDSRIDIGEKAFLNSAYYSDERNWTNGILYIGNHLITGCNMESTSLTLPASVRSIAKRAFIDRRLSAIKIPENSQLYAIGEEAFATGRITKATLPLRLLDEIPLSDVAELTVTGSGPLNYRFKKFEALKTVTIGDNFNSIGEDAFSGCQSLITINFGQGLTEIQNNAFLNCTSLKGIDIPDSVVTIGKSAFQDCSMLDSISFGNGLSLIQERTFRGCASLKTLTVPENIKCIKREAFRGCMGIRTLTIGNNVTTIEERAFANCASISRIYFGDSLETIESEAFINCLSLITLNIPSTVKTIGSGAFKGCLELDSVTLPFTGGAADATEASYSTVFGYIYGYTLGSRPKPVFDENENIIGYEDLDNGAKFQYAEYDSVTHSYNYFYYYIPSSLTSVHVALEKPLAYTFCNLQGVDLDLAFLGTQIEIGEYFAFSSGITELSIPYGVTAIGEAAFAHCMALSSVYWAANGFITAGSGDLPVFEGCSSLTTVKFGNNVEILPAYLFKNCSGLAEEVTIPEGVIWIGESVFENCNALTGVQLSNNVTWIGDATFKGCSELTAIVIPEKVIAIENFLFEGCTNLSSVVIGNEVKSIGKKAFSMCTSLCVIRLPDSIESIGVRVFENCYSLESAIFENAVNWQCIESVTGEITEILGGDLTDTCIAAEYLKEYYLNCEWRQRDKQTYDKRA